MVVVSACFPLSNARCMQSRLKLRIAGRGGRLAVLPSSAAGSGVRATPILRRRFPGVRQPASRRRTPRHGRAAGYKQTHTPDSRLQTWLARALSCAPVARRECSAGRLHCGLARARCIQRAWQRLCQGCGCAAGSPPLRSRSCPCDARQASCAAQPAHGPGSPAGAPRAGPGMSRGRERPVPAGRHEAAQRAWREKSGAGAARPGAAMARGSAP
jgi:hypothetical protein